MVFMVVGKMPQYQGGLQKLEADLNAALDLEKGIREELYIRCTCTVHVHVPLQLLTGKNCSMGHTGCVWDYWSGDEGGEILEGEVLE